jgi:hypothetical protein
LALLAVVKMDRPLYLPIGSGYRQDPSIAQSDAKE